jgi:hypothetical protein
MTLIGLDLDATRARAVSAPVSQPPAPLRLTESHVELPLALNLEGRQIAIGASALRLCRRLPDFACQDFLPYLGRKWHRACGRHRVDAERAVGLVADYLGRAFGRCEGAAIAVPSYLDPAQIEYLAGLADRGHWRLFGWTPRSLAAILAARDRLPWTGVVLVLDVDGHALTLSAVGIETNRAVLLLSESAPAWSRNVWLTRLLDGVAHRCIRLTRRDPRESAETEQHLYDQLLAVLEQPLGNQPVEMVLQTGQWYQRLSISAKDLAAPCAPLAAQVLVRLREVVEATAAHGPVGLVLLTASAARLPGLAAAVEAALPSSPVKAPINEDDFGEGLLEEENGPPAGIIMLDPDALARAAHYLAVRQSQGDLPRGAVQALPLVPRGTSPKLHRQAGDPPANPTRLPFPPATARQLPPASRRRAKDHE